MQSEGENAARAFIDAFNAQNHEALAATLNYPHIRLAGGLSKSVLYWFPSNLANVQRDW